MKVVRDILLNADGELDDSDSESDMDGQSCRDEEEYEGDKRGEHGIMFGGHR